MDDIDPAVLKDFNRRYRDKDINYLAGVYRDISTSIRVLNERGASKDNPEVVESLMIEQNYLYERIEMR